jgi:dTMP kinase
MKSQNGLFITLEGGEGAGKSTLAARLARTLSNEGHILKMTREPGGTPFGEELRNVILHSSHEKIEAKAELFLFLSARIQHVEAVIKPELARGHVVICDRFSDSTIAYQGEGKGLDFEYVQACCKLAVGNFAPHVTFYLDIDPKVGLARASRRGAPDRMEQEALQFHERVRSGFLRLAKEEPKRIHVLNAAIAPDTLFSQAYTILQSYRSHP